MKKIKTLVVDDERFNRDMIIHMVEKLKLNFEVIGQAESIDQARELIKHLRPQVVFLDVRMPGGSGFDLMDSISHVDMEVVFVTGYDSYAIKAFEHNALDYVLKPIQEDKFFRTLLKVKERIEDKIYRRSEMNGDMNDSAFKTALMNKIAIHEGKMVKLLSVDDLIFVLAKEGYTEFVAKPGGRHLSSKQLSDFEYIFSKQPFMIRINKSTYVNANEIRSYSKGMVCDVTLSDGSVFEISRRKKASVLEVLKKIM